MDLKDPRSYENVRFMLGQTEKETILIAIGPNVLDAMPCFRKTVDNQNVTVIK